LRAKGQFWTPDWVADAMVAYVCGEGTAEIFDPAVGAGAFFRAARRLNPALGLRGAEISTVALEEARASGLRASDLRAVALRDFVLDPPPGRHSAVVANPPYIRHHRLTAATKSRLTELSRQMLGFGIDGRAGYHVYFLLRALERLAPAGRLAFIMPSDTCEGVFAQRLWRKLATLYRVEAVVTFSPDATPFPGVDTNAIVLFMSNRPPRGDFQWARCEQSGDSLQRWTQSGFRDSAPGIVALSRSLGQAIEIGLSRPPEANADAGPRLGNYCTVMRGIATGANDFFFLTAEQIQQHRLPKRLFQRALGRTRDVEGAEVTADDLKRLESAGRATWLLALTGRESHPPAVAAYLRRGEDEGLPQRALIASRRPWYKMETRSAPPFLFAYLGRRNARFIRNRAAVLPLTGFLCVYPRPQWSSAADLDALWSVLNDARTLARLAWVGKSYGGGAIKVEPRALERLPLAIEALSPLLRAQARPERPQLRLDWHGAAFSA
jgi:hypothetical protein